MRRAQTAVYHNICARVGDLNYVVTTSHEKKTTRKKELRVFVHAWARGGLKGAAGGLVGARMGLMYDGPDEDVLRVRF